MKVIERRPGNILVFSTWYALNILLSLSYGYILTNCRVSSLVILAAFLEGNYQVLQGRRVVFLTGDLKAKDRTALLSEINSNLDEPVILLTTFCVGGVGHNLQRFTTVIFLDRNWNPQVIFIYLSLSVLCV